MSDVSTSSSASDRRTAALHALEWLRERYPLAGITATVNPSDEAIVAVRVEIAVADGPASSAHGAALAVEEAEDRAIVRAMEGLGYRGSVADEAPVSRQVQEPPPAPKPSSAPAPDDARSVFDEPVGGDLPPRPQPVSNDPPREPANRPPAAPAPLAGRSGQMGPPVMVRPRQQPPAPTPQRPAQARGGLRPVPDQAADDPRLEDVSWTEFWKWARARGFDSRESVNEAINRSMDGMTPREVRDLVKAYLGEEDD